MTTTLTAFTFATGCTYSTRSACDHDCVFAWKVTQRTAKSVWLMRVINGEPRPDDVRRRTVTLDGYGREMVYPMGKFSMCPVLTADDGGDDD